MYAINIIIILLTIKLYMASRPYFNFIVFNSSHVSYLFMNFSDDLINFEHIGFILK